VGPKTAVAIEPLLSNEDETGPEEVHIETEPAGDADVEQLKSVPDPGQPTEKEVEEHRTEGHQPFRSWCKFCVMGRGGTFHHKNLRSKSAIPRIGVDYFFITRGGVRKRDELEYPDGPEGNAAIENDRKSGDIVKCIVIRDWESKVTFAHCIPCKGADEDQYVAKLVEDDLVWLGYTRIVLKGDNEPALQALIRQVLGLIIAKPEEIEQATKESSRNMIRRPMAAQRWE
jgi:hypothetical protein